jgi:hypothetical protein
MTDAVALRPRRRWTFLRLLVVAAGLVGTAFYIGSLVTWWRIPGARRDGFELIGVALATAYFGALVLPTLVMGLLGRWLVFAALLGLAAVALATDTLWPWIPWR